MTNLHTEGLGDEELVEMVDQALASLNVRFGGDDPEWADEVFGAEAPAAAEQITATCDAWDAFASNFRLAKGSD